MSSPAKRSSLPSHMPSDRFAPASRCARRKTSSRPQPWRPSRRILCSRRLLCGRPGAASAPALPRSESHFYGPPIARQRPSTRDRVPIGKSCCRAHWRRQRLTVDGTGGMPSPSSLPHRELLRTVSCPPPASTLECPAACAAPADRPLPGAEPNLLMDDPSRATR